MGISWTCNLTLVLVIHDCADIFLEVIVYFLGRVGLGRVWPISGQGFSGQFGCQIILSFCTLFIDGILIDLQSHPSGYTGAGHSRLCRYFPRGNYLHFSGILGVCRIVKRQGRNPCNFWFAFWEKQ